METQSGAADFVTDVEITRHLNAGLAALYNQLVGARGEEYYARSNAIAMATGTDTYDLPGDFFQMIGVLLYDGSTYYQPPIWQYKETAQLKQLGVSGQIVPSALRYRVIGRERPEPHAGYNDRIKVLPGAKTGWTLTIDYLPCAPVLSLGTDTFDGVSGWEEHACLSAAIKMLAKEQTDATPLLTERAILDEQIQRMAGSRNADRPGYISDTKRDWSSLYFFQDNNWNR